MNKEGLEKLRAHADSLLGLLIHAYAKFLFLRPMMVNEGLIARIGGEGRRQGFEQLRGILYWDFINDIVKICADKDKRAPSILRLTANLEDTKVRELLEKKYASGRSLLNEQNQYQNEFSNKLIRLDENTMKLLNSKEIAGYKTIRDSLIAHNELRKTREGYKPIDIQPLGLKYGKEIEVLNLVIEIVDDLNSIIRSSGYSWNSFLEPEVRTVCEFWKIPQIEPDNSEKQYPWSPYGA